jgi:cation diffusion facilitator CzcD-associated flavoprotein CzcO
MAEIESYDVVIVGSGFAGVGLSILLQKEGIDDFVILEKAHEVGGTWRDNHYPGVACDVESHLYSFSFEPNPEWTRMFAPQREILEYLKRCVDKHDLRRRIRFDTAVTGAAFDESTGMWTVQTSDGRSIRARVLVSASGHALTTPVYPDIPGRQTFLGKTMHSSRWDDAYSLEGKTVAVVGTGASAIQIVPAIAPKVGKLHVFQRTAPWIMPKPDRDITERERERFRKHPFLQSLFRDFIYLQRELFAVGFVVDPRVNELASKLALRFLRKSVRDPALRQKLTPTYTMGCKRILPTNDWYPAITRDNVELVTDGIQEIRPHAIVTKDGKERPVDTIVFATGFEASEAKPPFAILGRGGRDLRDEWKGGIHAYYGMAIAGFPNLFLVIGPNNGLGHTSMIFMMESQFAYIIDAIKTIKRKNLKSVEIRRDVEQRHNEWLQRRLAKTVWNTGGCRSWYLTADGKNTTAWPGFTFEYRFRTRRFDVQSYQIEPVRS